MAQAPETDIAALAPGSAALWFAALSLPPQAGDIERVEALVAGGELRPRLRMVTQRAGEPFGRMAAQAVDGLLRFWHPAFRAGTPQTIKSIAMARMIREVIEARRRAALTHLPIETRPGDDLPDNDLWLRALVDEGFTETCAYRGFVLRLDTPAPVVDARDAACTISVIDADRQADLAALYRCVKAHTLDRRYAVIDRPREAVEKLKAIGKHDPSLWLMACLDGGAAGYALANLTNDPHFEGTSAWLIDIGCAPEQRQKGIAAALLDEICRRVRAAGARQILAVIDDINTPSLRLHASRGFTPMDERHYVYRLTAAP
jgi:GNAT superfamily N-acetyltransferase